MARLQVYESVYDSVYNLLPNLANKFGNEFFLKCVYRLVSMNNRNPIQFRTWNRTPLRAYAFALATLVNADPDHTYLFCSLLRLIRHFRHCH
jgi:hypothetical protein